MTRFLKKAQAILGARFTKERAAPGPAIAKNNGTAQNQVGRDKTWWDRAVFAFVASIQRDSGAATKEPPRNQLPALLVAFLALAYVGLATWSGVIETTERSRLEQDLFIPVDSWHALYDLGGLCRKDAQVDLSCPAHPENEALWRSPYLRQDPQKPQVWLDHIDRVKSKINDVFWIGTTIDVDLLQRAAAADANWLILGWVTGTYSIFIDGQEVARGEAVNNRLSQHVAVPLSRLFDKKPLKLAVRIAHDAGAKYPDIMARGKEQFGTSGHMAGWERNVVTQVETRPLALSLLNGAVAGLFLIIWVFSPQRRELAYLGAYVLLHAGIQLTLVDAVYNLIGREVVYPIDLLLRSLEGGFGLLLALAYARCRESLVRNTAFVLAVFSVAVMGLAWVFDRMGAANSAIGIVFVPGCYLGGAVLCAGTARYLSAGSQAQRLPHRVRRLVSVAVCFFLMAALYSVQATQIAGPDFISLYRTLHAFLVVIIITILLRDIAEQDRIIQGMPIPRWHLRVPMPSVVASAVTKADMKGSQAIVEEQGHETYEDTTAAWYTVLGEEILRQDGEVTFDEGDCIIGVREAAGPTFVECLLKAHAAAYLRLPELQRRYGVHHLAYRAAIAIGDIKPRWKSMLGVRRPAFSGRVLIEVGGLMERERKLSAEPEATRLILPRSLLEDHLSAELVRLIPWEYESIELTDKRGVAVLVAVWRLDSDSARAVLEYDAPDHPGTKSKRKDAA